jgi:hypothetical protein
MAETYGHVLKLHRALHHLEDLETFADEWLNSDHHTLIHEHDADARTYHVFAEADRPPRDPTALLIGDFLHGVRSALDHLAYALAAAYTIPLPQDVAEESEFPIFGDEDRKGTPGSGPTLFVKAAARKLRGVDPNACALIESIQPYQLGANFRDHNLWLLYDLARVDRHRLLHPTVAYFSGFGFNPAKSNARIGTGEIHSFAGLLENRTEVARIVGIEPLKPGDCVYMDVVIPLKLAFPVDSDSAAGKDVIETLGGIYNYVVTNVTTPLETFLPWPRDAPPHSATRAFT